MGKPSTGFVLIESKHIPIEDIVNQLKEIEIEKEIVLVEGLWKIVVKLQASDLDKIREAIQWKIRKMAGIESTLTLIEYMSGTELNEGKL